MTVIAWDGISLASDKMMVQVGLAMKVTKIKKVRDHLIGVSGNASAISILFDWFDKGADPEKWPDIQKDKDRWSYLLAITPEKKILFYEQDPLPIEIEDEFFACGSGRDYALAAMAMGASAGKAVAVASKFDVNCGNGIDVIEF